MAALRPADEENVKNVNIVSSGVHHVLRSVLLTKCQRARTKSAVVREGYVVQGNNEFLIKKATFDSGASNGNYIGQAMLNKIVASGMSVVKHPCRHRVRLGDGVTIVHIRETVNLEVKFIDDYGSETSATVLEFYVVPGLGEELLVGLHDIIGHFLDYFVSILEFARESQDYSGRVGRLCGILGRLEGELAREIPNPRRLDKLSKEAQQLGAQYSRLKDAILSRQDHTSRIANNGCGLSYEILAHPRLGTVFADSRVEDIVAVVEMVATGPEVCNFLPGEIVYPWLQPTLDVPEEELETPDPLAFGEDVLHFMETSVEESRRVYLEDLETHVSAGMRTACPDVMNLLNSDMALRVFAPAEWRGLNVEPVDFRVRPGLPPKLKPAARPVRRDLWDNARIEYMRLAKYLYVDSDSPIASPLVIAPKATAPFIRFCGDYREVNKFIEISQKPIPIVQHELTKAAKFRIYIDLDMANSFHQIPLTEVASRLLSIQTPWGLVRPLFLPEGVGPASGLLQHIVREIFHDFEDWTIVIFDNFLVLADDYDDAMQKLQKIIARCAEYNVVLKMKKSYIGVETVTFFGYEVTHGKWRLSQARKDSISAMQMPSNMKQMQQFLGAALFFQRHIPNYSDWSARLYEMTAKEFNWDPGTWQHDYNGHFERFKEAIAKATELYFPDYELQWVVRADASTIAAGAVLYQEAPMPDGDIVHQPIAFASKKFSDAATRWDVHKKEAFALYYAVSSFAYYLRGKNFLLETDHRNLLYIEQSLAPIVVRWRALLQSYQFLLRHIPGKENAVADWLSRQYAHQGVDSTLDALYSMCNMSTDEDIGEPVQFSAVQALRQVHGADRTLHFGASVTWEKLNKQFPGHGIPMQYVRDYVRDCPLCQKLRDTGIGGVEPLALHLKPPHYRKRVGIDHVTVTPEDKHGNKAVVLIVEHFSRFPQAYPVKEYTAESAATALFKHICTFGVFDELISDPGSAFMSEVLAHLLQFLGVQHKVSLVGRHQSNGCEGVSKQFLRHLKTLVHDERLVDKWSDDTVLPLINFALCSFPTKETGGFTPFELKYGSADAPYFRLPENIDTETDVHTYIRALNDNLNAVRDVSVKLQAEIVQERTGNNGVQNVYQPGDFILYNPKENPNDHLASKLEPTYLGPYVVIRQLKNDIKCRHVVLQKEETFHVSRCKAFFGSRDDAIAMGKLDKNQFFIISINYYTGNPNTRSTMEFNVTFENETQMVPYNDDLADTEQFENFVLARPELFPLRYSAKIARAEIAALNKLAITEVSPGDKVYVDIRSYQGNGASVWYDTLDLPEKYIKTYVVEYQYLDWLPPTRTRGYHCMISAKCDAFDEIYSGTTALNHYFVHCWGANKVFDNDTMILLSRDDVKKLP